MISVKNLSFSHTGHPLLENVSFSVGRGQRVALTGPNGAGKSTLFKLLTKSEKAPTGDILLEGTIGYVPQEVKHDLSLEKTTIRTWVDPSFEKDDFELIQLLENLEMEDVDLYASPNTLSGGQKTKLAIAKELIAQPDILLLDEPTNFLDTKGKQWVMNFLSYYPHTLLIISHDLALLDKAIDKVIALNPQTKNAEEYKGTYSKYLKLKAEHDDLLKRHVIQEQKHIKKMEESVRKMYANKSKKGVRQRVVLARRVERMKENLPDLPQELQRIRVNLPLPAHIGEIPIMAKHIGKSYEDHTIISDAYLAIRKQERIALIGPNGSGKSTFIKMLVGILTPDTGEIIKDTNLSLGYYSQEFETFDFDKTVLETMQDASSLHESVIRPFLAGFLFPRDKMFQKIGTLSGGEKTRLSLALILLKNHNLLILDEPTTYLDPLSQRIILNVLKNYKGSILVVSHTEDFIKELAPHRAMLLPQNRVVSWDVGLLEKVNEI